MSLSPHNQSLITLLVGMEIKGEKIKIQVDLIRDIWLFWLWFYLQNQWRYQKFLFRLNYDINDHQCIVVNSIISEMCRNFKPQPPVPVEKIKCSTLDPPPPYLGKVSTGWLITHFTSTDTHNWDIMFRVVWSWYNTISFHPICKFN